MLTQPNMLSPSISPSNKFIPDSEMKIVSKKLSLKDESFIVTSIATPTKPKI